MLNIILFGPPGSGKGTQAEKLRDQFSLFHISTGEIFRREIKGKTILGEEVSSFMSAGKLVPDELTFRVLTTEIENNLSLAKNGTIFDGYPRTIPQAEIMDAYFAKQNTTIAAVLSLVGREEVFKERIKLRAIVSGRPDDADENVINHRMQVYRDQTFPLADFYAAQKKYVELNGEETIEEVFNSLCKKINGLLGQH